MIRMKQYTLRQIQDLPLNEKLDFLKKPRELGVKTAGPKGEFEVKGVYLPLDEYKRLKGWLDADWINRRLIDWDFSLFIDDEKSDLKISEINPLTKEVRLAVTDADGEHMYDRKSKTLVYGYLKPESLMIKSKDRVIVKW